ncbi:PAX3- and PAX7-binding protein 1-like isoform X2 [Patella vulgata]|uniref:PAX3- and PAX7-binding protein 1-like isoform X2 n=1 Tax=Patella vulgata TaxID=6465 RepID=UPI0024A929A5|nr:PAX3- and PAX7-binding protein 1-like isoform X2 [Patella vulgata]
MSGMFKKPKRNFRKKLSENNSDEENGDSFPKKKECIPFLEDVDEMAIDKPIEVEQKNEVNNVKKVKKKKGAKEKSITAPTVLSFDHDEDADTEFFKVKKSTQSRRLAKQLKKEKIVEKDDKEINQGSTRKDRDSEQDIKDKSKDKADEKLKQLREELRTMNGDDAENLEGSDDEDEQHTFRAMLARGEIPDAKTIHMIRKQRQQARNDDFLPLEESEQAAQKKKESRLVRDDEHDRSDDEEEERVDFTINNADRERQRMRDDFLAAEHGSDEESDHEREWEAQQIRKAALMPGQEALTYEQNSSNSVPEPIINYNMNNLNSVATGNVVPLTNQFKPFASLMRGKDSSNITIESIRKRLQERMNELDTVYRTHKLELDRLVHDVEDTEKEMEECTEKVPVLEKQYKFFQEMRGYVRDLVECLNEKVPTINSFETRMNNILRQRADILLQRRQQDVRDQCQDYMTNKKHQVVMETQEEHSRQRRVAEREARRSRRRRARESKNIFGHHDGLSSDDEENQSEISKFVVEKGGFLYMSSTPGG